MSTHELKWVDFRPSEVVSDAIFGNLAETCCELAIVHC